MTTTTTQRTNKAQAYHHRQTSAGRVLIQAYVDAETAAAMKAIAGRRQVAVREAWEEAGEKFVAYITAIEAAAWRAVLDAEGDQEEATA